jgi:hypothetical protein
MPYGTPMLTRHSQGSCSLLRTSLGFARCRHRHARQVRCRCGRGEPSLRRLQCRVASEYLSARRTRVPRLARRWPQHAVRVQWFCARSLVQLGLSNQRSRVRKARGDGRRDFAPHPDAGVPLRHCHTAFRDHVSAGPSFVSALRENRHDRNLQVSKTCRSFIADTAALLCFALRCAALRCAALLCVALRCVALRCVALLSLCCFPEPLCRMASTAPHSDLGRIGNAQHAAAADKIRAACGVSHAAR